jgi:hypothetical protein
MAEEKPREKQHNFGFGVGWEKWVGNYLRKRYGGTYDLSPGSRGPSDVTNLTPRLVICTQCKASRGDSRAHPSVSEAEKLKLCEKAKKLANFRGVPAVALLARIKGNKVRFERLGLFRPDKVRSAHK